MKYNKRIISLCLALGTLLTIVSGLNFSVHAEDGNEQNVDLNSNISIETKYEAFDVFSEAVSEVEEEAVTEANNISRITFSNKTATVNLKTTVDSKLLVGVYTEDEKQLLGVGTKSVTTTTTEVTLDVDITSMPEYFIAKGYIVDNSNMKPISTVYTCTYYTEDMQKLFKSNIDSYDRDRVVNFDDSYNNNFAVYHDDVIQESTSETSNIVVSDDDNTCIVESPTDIVKGLKEGDVLALGSDYEDLIYLKVECINVDENTVTISKNDEFEITDLFECVKISNSDDLYEVEKMTTKQQNSYSDISVCASNDEIDDSGVKTITNAIGTFSGSAKATGNLSLTMTLGFDFFVSPAKIQRSSISLYLDYKLQFNFDITVTGSADFNKMPYFSYKIAAGLLEIKATPNIKVDFNLEVHLVISYYGRVGMNLDTAGNFTNISQPSTLDGSLTAEGTLKVDFGLEIALIVLSGPELIKGNITPHFILTATAKLDNSHKCLVCFAGNLSYNFKLDYGVKFFKKDKYYFGGSKSIKNGELCKFYYSATTGKLGTGKCPNVSNERLRTLRVIYDNGSPAKYASVKLYKCDCTTLNVFHRFYGLSHYKVVVGNYKADKNGIVKFYLDAEENGYRYVLDARLDNVYGQYYFPWYGETNNYTYPITINKTGGANVRSANNTSTVSILSDVSTVSNYNEEKSENSNGVRTIKYSNLTPNEKYNFYSLTKNTNGISEDLTSSTILYLQQYEADENGELTVTFNPKKTVSNPVDCLLAMGQDDISIADIKQSDITCKTNENNVYPYVSVYNRLLVENRDYTVEGEITSSTAGEHTFYIVGMGNYKGKVECKYNSILYMDDYDNICTKADELISEKYFTSNSKEVLQKAVETTKETVVNTNDQIVVDNAVSEISEKIDELDLIDYFEETTENGTQYIWNKDNLSLTISGTGSITAPCDWDFMKNKVKNLIIKGFTNIETEAFSNYGSLIDITFDSNIKSIAKGAFSGCESLTNVYYTRNSNEWKNIISEGETGLENATVNCSINCVSNTHTWSAWKYNNDSVYNSSSDYTNGTQTRTCSTCGESETAEAPNTALLRRRGNALSLESSITLTTYITKDVVDYYDEVYAEFTRNNTTQKVYASGESLTSGSTVYYVFDYDGISPQTLGDDINITFYGVKDGVTYNGNTYEYSPANYISSTLKSTTSAKLKTLLVDLVYYGEACQVYQNYKTDNLLTDILTDEQKALRSTADLSLTNIKNSKYSLCENRLVKFGTALRLNNSVEMAIPMNMTDVTLDELSLKVKVGSRTMTYTYSKNPENFEKGSDGYWYFYFDGIYANQMSDEVFITAYKDDEQVSYTLKYSIESYASTVTDAKLKAVTDAMMRYGISAKAYAGK